jgi:hypothetical protein
MKREQPVQTEASTLAEILKKDQLLNENSEKKILFAGYATLFDSELEENLHLTSIELNAKYNTANPSSWRLFLRHPLVKNYIDGFLSEKAEKTADMALGAADFKPKDAMAVKEQMSLKNKGEDNSNILVVFLPQKDYTL